VVIRNQQIERLKKKIVAATRHKHDTRQKSELVDELQKRNWIDTEILGGYSADQSQHGV
jgi:hypothetical protein